MKRLTLLMFSAIMIAIPAQAKDDKDELSACRADMGKYCKGVEPGEGRQMKCMYELRDKLTPACASLVKEKYERFVALRKAKEGK
ncbi:MAG: cysteine rich repeat-containing protein [Sulfuritalea sp.]|nr:cysteine rich repeat-containing protein [Sulfuritalea sp.]